MIFFLFFVIFQFNFNTFRSNFFEKLIVVEKKVNGERSTLKPENILLDKYLFPKIADFGLSKSDNLLSATKTAINVIKGTPIYMSPEIWSKGQYSQYSDVYAFAIVVYEIMTCENPYPDTDIFTLGINVKGGGRPDFKIQVPEAYKYLIIRCWSQKTTNRPTFNQIINELRTDRNFILDTINEDEYLNYIKYIDEYKMSFDSTKLVIPQISFKLYKSTFLKNIINDDENENEDEQIKVVENFIIQCIHFPYKYFNSLCETSQKIIKEAEAGDTEKQFEVARNMIEGRYDFPIDVKIGLDFLKSSMNKGNNKSLLYYIEMIIKGDNIPSDHNKAQKLIESKFSEDDAMRHLMLGKLCKNEKRYVEASDHFKRSIILGNIDSIYEYAEVQRKHFNEENVEQYYKEAIERGHLKSMFKYGLILINSEEEEKQEEGYRLIKLSADKGLLNSIYYYGTLIEKEEGEMKSKECESMKYFKRAADEGHAKSMNKYGVKLLQYLKSLRKAENKMESIIYLKKASDKGYFESMHEYGKIIVDGDIEIPSDPRKGMRYIKISADEGNADAMGRYGSLLRDGKGVDVNYEEAVKYYKMGIEKGSVVSMNSYGYMLKNGQGVEVNYKEAIKYYKMAIDKGYPNSMSNYARMLQNGQGVEVNYEEAIKYYKMAIDKGNASAMNNYARMLLNGHGVEIDYKEAIKYFKMAIDKSNPTSMNNYAYMLQNGQGTEIDYKEAIKYYKMAIDKGNSFAMNNYATMLRKGLGCEIDYKEAIKYYKMAIDKGNSSSMNNYATMLRTGLGCEIDYIEAVKYYKMAIDKGFGPSMTNYAMMLNKGEGVKMDKIKAKKYFEIAISKKDAEAMLQYGLILLENNDEKGLSYIEESAKKGNAEAEKEFKRISEERKIKKDEESK